MSIGPLAFQMNHQEQQFEPEKLSFFHRLFHRCLQFEIHYDCLLIFQKEILYINPSWTYLIISLPPTEYVTLGLQKKKSF